MTDHEPLAPSSCIIYPTPKAVTQRKDGRGKEWGEGLETAIMGR